MTRFIRTSLLPSVAMEDSYLKPYPNWSPKFLEWYRDNEDAIVKIHENIDYRRYCKEFVIEFVNEDEALLFLMRFANEV